MFFHFCDSQFHFQRVFCLKKHIWMIFSFKTLKNCEFSFVIGSLSVKFPYVENIFYGA